MSIRWACNEVKWAWQRVFRGWDDRATWSADYYFARQISEILDAIKSDCGIPHFVFIDLGIPVDTFITEEQEQTAKTYWDNIIQKIVDGFRAYLEAQEIVYTNPERYGVLVKQYEEGFDLFKKHFGAFWT